jgi:RNA polymerase sigma factor (sigma-70 family)
VTDLSVDISDVPTADLVTCARAGSRPAWEELVDRFTPLLWSIALRHRLDHADAADVVQTTWLRLVEHLYRIREPSRVPGWLVTTCRREAVQMRRMNARWEPQDTTDPSSLLGQRHGQDDAGDPVDVVLGREAATTLRSAIEDLPARQQQLLTSLTEASERSRYAQAAAALNVPVGSIGPIRQRALRRLRADSRLRAIWEITSRAG